MTELVEFYGPGGIFPETGDMAKLAGDMARLGERYPDSTGWLDPEEHAGQKTLDHLAALAGEVRREAGVFVLIGVGGSNNGARAVLKALGTEGGPEILYGGTNLSPSYMNRLLGAAEGKSVYINLIAKNFATLEPGICFRFLRGVLEQRYGAEAKRRIIVTGSRRGNDGLYRFAGEKGYRFLDFPENIGGRYSAVSAVGLFPMAVGGVDIHGLVRGAREMAEFLKSAPPEVNPALRCAAARNFLHGQGYTNEILSCFEPELEYFAKWWVQLFAESGGKDGKGIFPSACVFSEDLHSLGQYIQQGRRMIMETFLKVAKSPAPLPVPPEEGGADRFSYLDGKDLAGINRAAFDATFKAHAGGGVPCMTVEVPDISARSFGGLFYFFEYACAASGLLLGTDPFDQPGVEAYKQNLMTELRGQ